MLHALLVILKSIHCTVALPNSLPRSRFVDVTQCTPLSFGGPLRDIQKTAARETTLRMVTPRNFVLIKPKSTLYNTKGKECAVFCIGINQETRDKKWDYFIAYQRGNINETMKPNGQLTRL